MEDSIPPGHSSPLSAGDAGLINRTSLKFRNADGMPQL